MIEELTEFTGNKASNIATAIEDRYEEAIDAWEKEMEEKEMEENIRRASYMVSYGMELGYIKAEDKGEAIEIGLKIMKSFTPQQILDLDAKINEAKEKEDLEMMQDMGLLYHDPEKICEDDDDEDPYEDVE
tara:strand:+ start:10282 stop:10674 length:393 start_codon:yes stop_codon:yes gene_type:complete